MQSSESSLSSLAIATVAQRGFTNYIINSCPRFEQCRCDVYGWCGPLPSGESLQAVIMPDLHDGSPT
jgi:hypothetical protein